jgi:hypothetical protein
MESKLNRTNYVNRNWSQNVPISYNFRAKTGEVVVLNVLNIFTNKEIPLCECIMLVIPAIMPLVDYR